MSQVWGVVRYDVAVMVVIHFVLHHVGGQLDSGSLIDPSGLSSSCHGGMTTHAYFILQLVRFRLSLAITTSTTHRRTTHRPSLRRVWRQYV